MLSRTARPLLLVTAGLALAGCVDMDVQTSLKADGSGTMAMKVGFTEGFVKIVQKLKEIDPEDDTVEGAESFVFEAPTDEEKAAMKAAGCELLEFEGEQSETKIFSRFKVGFQTLASLSALDNIQSDDEKDDSGPGDGMKLVKNDDGTYTLSMTNDDDEASDDEIEEAIDDAMGDGGEESAEEEDPEEAMKKAAAAMELMGQMMAEMANLKIVIGMEVPGEVVSFAPAIGKKDGGKVTWTIDMSTAMGGGADMNEGFSVTFKLPEGQSIPESALTPVKAKAAEPAEEMGEDE